MRRTPGVGRGGVLRVGGWEEAKRRAVGRRGQRTGIKRPKKAQWWWK